MNRHILLGGPPPPPHPRAPESALAFVRSLVHSHLFEPRLGDFLLVALAHATVAHHALSIVLPEGAFHFQVHFVVLEEDPGGLKSGWVGG